MKLDSLKVLNELLNVPKSQPICILDSCGVGYLGSKKLLGGLGTPRMYSIKHADPIRSLSEFAAIVERESTFSFFTVSYDFGALLNGIPQPDSVEPDFWVAEYDEILEFDYPTQSCRVLSASGARPFNPTDGPLLETGKRNGLSIRELNSNFNRDSYKCAVEDILEEIRRGYTYQTNLTQKFRAQGDFLEPATAFLKLRDKHPAAFSAYLKRGKDTVLSISPERFFRISENEQGERIIASSPIKGTAERGSTPAEDAHRESELRSSPKNRAENTMIVDLIRNDLGRICDYGTVNVESHCEIEKHATLFHLVSTVTGKLRSEVSISEVFSAMYPCGSITGAPKLSTMKIIDQLEDTPRGLSMGAIGYADFGGRQYDLSVAIRTLTITDETVQFNVGGGIVIDSEPEAEYEESLLKAKALLHIMGAKKIMSEL